MNMFLIFGKNSKLQKLSLLQMTKRITDPDTFIFFE